MPPENSPEYIALITDVAGIKAELPYIRRDIGSITTVIGEHGATLAEISTKLTKICERLPDRKTDHQRDDDPPAGPPAGKWPLAWMVKIGTIIGVSIGTAVITYQAGPEIIKSVVAP